MGAFDMRKLLPGSVALVALCVSIPAMAADLEVGAPGPAYKAVRPVVRAYDWSGFYVGGNVGGHWGTDKVTWRTSTSRAVAQPPEPPSTEHHLNLHPEGFIGGVQAGLNLEGSGGVFGIEVDANWLERLGIAEVDQHPGHHARRCHDQYIAGLIHSTMRMRWGTTVLSDRSLFYVTAGFAFATVKTTDAMGHFGNTLITSVTGSTTEPG